MHMKLTNRRISAALALLMSASFIGMWGIYLFVANPESAGSDYVSELFLDAINPSNEGALFFQATLASIVLCAVIAGMAVYAKNLIPVIVLGTTHAGAAMYLYTWDDGLLASAVVLPLILELRNA